jgi:hypothetical protein
MGGEAINPGAQFATAVGEMLLAFGVSRDRFDTARMQTYWQHLRDIPGAVLLAGARDLIKASHHFPTVAEWRRACDAVDHNLFYENERPRLTEGDGPAPETWDAPGEGGHWCHECGDTGFVTQICRSGARCGVTRWLCAARERETPEYTHRYVTICACRAVNPVIARRIEEAKKHKEARYSRKIEGVS